MAEENEQQQEQDGFENALAAFADEGEPAAGAPNAAGEGEVAKVPETPETKAEPEPEPPKEAQSRSPEITALEKKLETLERDNARNRQRADYWMQNYQQRTVAPAQPAVPATQQQPFSEPEPEIDDFPDTKQWSKAVARWAKDSATAAVLTNVRQETAQQQEQRQKEEVEAQERQFLERKTQEGWQKFGEEEFVNACEAVADFAPFRSSMNYKIFNLQRYADVVMELSKNPAEASRISRLDPEKQSYELQSLERKLIAGEELRQKAQTKIPTKVEAPGQGEDPKGSPSMTKLKHAAYASGSLRDMAKIFEADQTL